MSTVIRVENVCKRYGDKTIIEDMSLRIGGGEFFTLLGPSGCGKTTLLRMIAGFNSIEGGDIYFNEDKINSIPPYKRNIGMVFQNYAIFPHMSVRQNIEYGLKQRKLPKAERQRRAEEMMRIVRIEEHATKSPNQLSGGQQQRVALGRAIVIHPTVLLMDEPLSNLDAKLRVEMRGTIRDIQKKVDITTVYVTHDQEEALAVSDRIAVINFGEIQQIDTPENLYKRPANEFVATFIGTSNVFEGVYQGNGTITVGSSAPIKMDNLAMDIASGDTVRVAVRPEEFSLSSEAKGLKGVVRSRMFLGKTTNYGVELESGEVIEVSQDSGGDSTNYQQGSEVYLVPDTTRINIFDATGARSLIRGE